MKISFIVPVYNVEEYVLECIKSLISQTLDNFEIIVVDDGCKDNSIDIIKSINDDRIKIIHQENRGLSGARNSGLKIANGEYVAFIDSDDYIGINSAYDEMYNLAKKGDADIVAGNAIWFYSKDDNYPMKRNMEMFKEVFMKSEQFFINSIKSKRIYAPVWLNIYKRQLLLDNDIWFKEGIFHEDEEFTPRVLLKAKDIAIYDKEFYIYRQRGGSITNGRINEKRGIDLLETYIELQEVFNSITNNELEILIREYWARLSLDQIYKYNLKSISYNIKKMIRHDCSSKQLKIRSYLLNINTSLYINMEKIYRFIKK